ncbi:helix-turn-helix domain-containing protein [Thiocystis violacea]|uniref:helix-turn-helix domain-containing protein n=1 Tax=Thiocystis violacea TaxID=13725 RepID=UPI0019030B4A|nr:helix-turn-helix domain-containing protein [Thiocystis violacea]MBK1724942.1 hypothetical protein [Thiocystis violacea]
MKSIRVERALKKLGADIRDARRRRRISTELMAERMGVSRGTLNRLEAGNPQVAISAWASALMILGKLDALADLVDRTQDPLGLDLLEEQLPQRIREGRVR